MLEYKIEELKLENLEEALKVIEVTFLKFEAPEYSKEGVELKFYLNKGTFFSNLPKGEDTPEKYAELIKLFSGLINNKHKEFASASGKGQEIIVKLRKPVTTNSDIKELIAIINTMYTAYLVSANLGKW